MVPTKAAERPLETSKGVIDSLPPRRRSLPPIARRSATNTTLASGSKIALPRLLLALVLVGAVVALLVAFGNRSFSSRRALTRAFELVETKRGEVAEARAALARKLHELDQATAKAESLDAQLHADTAHAADALKH